MAAAGRTHPSDLAARHLMYRTYTSELKFFFSAGRTGYGSFTLGKRHLPRHAAFSVSPPRLSIEFSKTRMRAAVSILISSSAWGWCSVCMHVSLQFQTIRQIFRAFGVLKTMVPFLSDDHRSKSWPMAKFCFTISKNVLSNFRCASAELKPFFIKSHARLTRNALQT